ncbi:hypothetical protein AMTR_s05659p00000220 [Amborella trichopoda]|uniref:Uncharacterized protein n=1 Tax=Amborella trichopoda TaxID=13333 RepID=U5CVK1_AMBTC|nr:hypothetical protein AMTR_s05659p00000220 [Amborella trichopoda]
MEVGATPSPWQRNSVLREEFRGLIVARTSFFLGHAKGASPRSYCSSTKKDNRRSQRRRRHSLSEFFQLLHDFVPLKHSSNELCQWQGKQRALPVVAKQCLRT